MDIVTGHIGSVEIVCGPMYSGKSEELIRLRRTRKRVPVFRPAKEDQYSLDEILAPAISA